MFDFLLPVLSLASAAQQQVVALTDDEVTEIRQVCELPETAQLVDARDMASADELATYLEAFGHPTAIIHGAAFAGDDVEVLLGKLEGGCIHRSDLSKTQAKGAKFTNSALINSSIEGADWSEARLNGTRFVGVNAKEAELLNAHLRGGSWVGGYANSNLLDADFTGSDMRNFTFECGITFDESCGANGRATFERVDFTDADLVDYRFLAYKKWEGAKFARTRMYPGSIVWLDDIEIGDSVIFASSARRHNEPSEVITAREFKKLYAEAKALRTDAPTFDCDKAEGYVEETICWSLANILRAYDRDLAEVYKAARKQEGRKVRRAQRQWLARRNACTEFKCISKAYQDRISQLLAVLGAEVVLAPDQERRFHINVLPVREKTRRSELFRRILPVLRTASASRQEVTLTGLEDGNIRVEGSAIGANAHICTWEAETRYDAATGWYVADVEGDEPIPMFRVWRGKLEPRYSGIASETPDEAAEFISCGARAYFYRYLQFLGDD